MFSCCRANPEKDSNIKTKNKKDKQKKGSEADPRLDGSNENKLIIPTITIENSKSNDTNTEAETPTLYSGRCVGETNGYEISERSEEDPLNHALYSDTSSSAIGEDHVEEETTVARSTRNEESLKDIHCHPTEATEVVEDSGRVTVAIHVVAADVAEDANSPLSTHDQNVQSKSSPSISTDDTNSTVIYKICSTSAAAAARTSEEEEEEEDEEPSPGSADSFNPDLPPKSCLSRHNSTHTSIKKKVNISTEAEIIEPDPLPPPPYDHPSLIEDDDVFSDSMPPPKRESMCAPYIEKDDIPETFAFAHGLPEWFNDERINEIGCMEPPVTPVGRDELELKRQRLYSDLLRAAHAAVEHNVRFYSLGTENFTHSSRLSKVGEEEEDVEEGGGACASDLKPSIAHNLEFLVNRLEQLVERLERSVSARELEIANQTFSSVLEKKRESFDLETTDLPPIPAEQHDKSSLDQATEFISQTGHLNQRIERIETTLNKLNGSYSNSLSQNSNQQQKQQQLDGSLENIPTVLEDYQTEESTQTSPQPPTPSPPAVAPPSTSLQAQQPGEITNTMSVSGYQDIMNGPLSQYLALSSKIGGDVAQHAALVKLAFDAQMQYVTLATQCAEPGQDRRMELLKPTSTHISAIQDYREKNRASPFFNHLSAISESIPALGWVCVSPTPGPHVKEMNDAGQFYTNRVLKEWKEKNATHVEWARAWIQTLTELQQYIKQHHTTGLVWSGKGGAAPPPPPMGACPPPPPPPTFDLGAMSLDGGADERSALFAEINQGEAITKNLKKVTDDMQTHKNATLRTGPAPFKPPTQFGTTAVSAPAVSKPPVFMRDGKKWLIEHQKNNAGLIVENAEMNNVVYMFKCEGSTLTVKGKVNNIVLDSCKKCSLLFDSVVASIEFVNCQSVQMQVLGFVPTVSIDKTDGCQMYLSKDSMGVEIVSSKSSEMNVMLPGTNGDYTELAVPEQYKTTITGKTLKTVCVDSLG